jgi:hypothetical protein
MFRGMNASSAEIWQMANIKIKAYFLLLEFGQIIYQ